MTLFHNLTLTNRIFANLFPVIMYVLNLPSKASNISVMIFCRPSLAAYFLHHYTFHGNLYISSPASPFHIQYTDSTTHINYITHTLSTYIRYITIILPQWALEPQIELKMWPILLHDINRHDFEIVWMANCKYHGYQHMRSI